jgi:hypothetical protein
MRTSFFYRLGIPDCRVHLNIDKSIRNNEQTEFFHEFFEICRRSGVPALLRTAYTAGSMYSSANTRVPLIRIDQRD